MRVRSAATDYPFAEKSAPYDSLVTLGCSTMLPQKWDEMLRDGFMETGDVMEQRGPNTVVWIDRKKNIMKLSQVTTLLVLAVPVYKLQAWHQYFNATFPSAHLASHISETCKGFAARLRHLSRTKEGECACRVSLCPTGPAGGHIRRQQRPHQPDVHLWLQSALLPPGHRHPFTL